MMSLSRVVWSEGMHLAQHHFQAQARYFEDLTAFAVQNLFFAPWGFTSLELDAEALLNGTVVLTHASGIMPDGLAFSFPADGSPEPLEIRELFAPTQESQVAYLAIPEFRAGVANTGAAARFSAETVQVPDDLTGEDTKPIGVAHKNFRLLLQGSPLEGLVELPDVKADALRAERAAAAGGAGSGYASREVAAFWLSHAVHSSLPALRGL